MGLPPPLYMGCMRALVQSSEYVSVSQVVDEVLFEKSTHAMRDDLCAFVGTERERKESDLCNEATKDVAVEILGTHELDMFGSALHCIRIHKSTWRLKRI